MSVYAGRHDADATRAATWDRRRVVATNLRSVLGRAYPRFLGLTREPSWLFFEVLLPLLSTFAFVFVYRALQAPEQYVGFVVLGGAMTAFWSNVVWGMAAQLYWERDGGNLELYFTAPISMMSVLLGMAFGGLVSTSLRAAVVLAIGTAIFGVTYGVTDWAALGAVFVLTMAALYGLGMLLASVFLMWGREGFHLSQLLTEPVYFFGGVYAPLRALGPIGALAVSILPLATGLDAIRQIAFPGPDSAGVFPVPVEIGILVVMTVAFGAAARLSLRTLERLARREGRLTVRWR
ncbi:MAG: ABC transporter permease [Chloroflexota bacterium]